MLVSSMADTHDTRTLTMRFTKALGTAGALILAALVGGTLIGATLATDETDPPADASTYCDTFLDSLASELGVTRDELAAAGRTAANAAVDAAVAAGDLDDERADVLRERIDAFEGDGCGLFGHGAFGRGFGAGLEKGLERGLARGLFGADAIDAAADALGIDPADLLSELRDAGSLEAVADARGASYDEVKATILAAVTADLDDAVAEGMDQARADRAVERLTEWLDEGGPLGEGPGFGPGRWHHHFGPWGPDNGSSDEEEEEEDAAA
jgi:hypothetical protein